MDMEREKRLLSSLLQGFQRGWLARATELIRQYLEGVEEDAFQQMLRVAEDAGGFLGRTAAELLAWFISVVLGGR